MTMFRIILVNLSLLVVALSIPACGEEDVQPATDIVTGNSVLGSDEIIVPVIDPNRNLVGYPTGQQIRGAGFSSLSQNQLGNSHPGIWVTGQGSVSLNPDLALLSVQVEADAKTVSKALL